MFKTAYTKMTVLMLALVVCLMTVCQPVLVFVVAAQGIESASESDSKSKSNSETETEKLLEGKEFCPQTVSSRRVRQVQHNLMLQSPMVTWQHRELPVLSDFNPSFQSDQIRSLPIFRAPPA